MPFAPTPLTNMAETMIRPMQINLWIREIHYLEGFNTPVINDFHGNAMHQYYSLCRNDTERVSVSS